MQRRLDLLGKYPLAPGVDAQVVARGEFDAAIDGNPCAIACHKVADASDCRKGACIQLVLADIESGPRKRAETIVAVDGENVVDSCTRPAASASTAVKSLFSTIARMPKRVTMSANSTPLS